MKAAWAPHAMMAELAEAVGIDSAQMMAAIPTQAFCVYYSTDDETARWTLVIRNLDGVLIASEQGDEGDAIGPVEEVVRGFLSLQSPEEILELGRQLREREEGR